MREQLDFYFSKYLLTKIKGVSSFEDIWVLSHDDDHGFMKNILKKIDRLEHMKFIEIRRYLAVKNIKVNQAKKTVEQVCDKLKERCKKMRKNYQNISYEYIK